MTRLAGVPQGGLRILFITRKYPPAVGGMETWSAELVRELRAGQSVTLHALPGRTDGGAPGPAAILRFGLSTATALLVRSAGHDVIQGGDLATWPLVLLARLRSRCAVVALAAHGTDAVYGGRRGFGPALYRRYMRLGVRLLPRARVIANSTATAARARALGFRRVSVVPLATRLAAPPPPPPEPFLLFAGRLVRRKGLGWFVSEVLPRLPEITLAVAGTEWDRSETAALYDPRVRWLGPLPQPGLLDLMARATAVVAPNIAAGPGHFEGFGLVAVEAAAAGGVVLASRLDGFSDSVIDGETGLLLPPGDAAAWAAAVQQVLGWDGTTRARFTSRAQTAARRRFSWDRVGRDVLAVYARENPTG